MKNRALFLDRDGVVNVDFGYVSLWENIIFYDEIFPLVTKAQEKNFLPIIVTNQSGIARGYYSENTYELLMRKILNEFKKYGTRIHAVYHCPYLKNAEGKLHELRKPNAGMFVQAAYDHEIDLNKSVLVGDSVIDLRAGYNAGVRDIFLFENGSNSSQIKSASELPKEIYYKTVSSLLNITEFLF